MKQQQKAPDRASGLGRDVMCLTPECSFFKFKVKLELMQRDTEAEPLQQKKPRIRAKIQGIAKKIRRYQIQVPHALKSFESQSILLVVIGSALLAWWRCGNG